MLLCCRIIQANKHPETVGRLQSSCCWYKDTMIHHVWCSVLSSVYCLQLLYLFDGISQWYHLLYYIANKIYLIKTIYVIYIIYTEVVCVQPSIDPSPPASCWELLQMFIISPNFTPGLLEKPLKKGSFRFFIRLWNVRSDSKLSDFDLFLTGSSGHGTTLLSLTLFPANIQQLTICKI